MKTARNRRLKSETSEKSPILETGRILKDEPWKHNRRAIMYDASVQWVGWDAITKLHDRAVELGQWHDLYFTILFETGGRISEAILLHPEQFQWSSELLRVSRMEVLKHRAGKRSVRHTRTVYIKIDGDPLAPALIDHVEHCETKFLLPGYGEPFSRAIDPESHVSRVHVYKKILDIDSDIWPHWLRDQRAWQLSAPIELGGCGFDSYELKSWFGWARMDMPAYYAGRRGEQDILRKLGVRDIKEPRLR